MVIHRRKNYDHRLGPDWCFVYLFGEEHGGIWICWEEGQTGVINDSFGVALDSRWTSNKKKDFYLCVRYYGATMAVHKRAVEK